MNESINKSINKSVSHIAFHRADNKFGSINMLQKYMTTGCSSKLQTLSMFGDTRYCVF